MSNGILDSDQSRELQDLLGSLEEQMIKKALQSKVEEESKQVISESNISEPTGVEKYVRTTRDHISKRNTNRLDEKNDLLAGPESVTSAQLKQSNQELWNRVQTALSGIGGGGLGAADVLDLIRRNPSYDFYTDSDFDVIASRLDDQLVKRAGDSMYGTLHLNHYDGERGSSLLQLDVYDDDSGTVDVVPMQSSGDYANLSFRLHGTNDKKRINFRAGPNNNSKLGDVLSIKGDGNIEINPATKTDNYSRWDNHDVDMRFYGTTSKIEMYQGYIASDIIRSSDSSLRLFKDYGSLKAKFDTSLTEFWNEQVRVHGKLYVDDSGTFGNDVTIGGDLNVYDIYASDVDCDDFKASNADISGNLTASTAQFSDNVSVGGNLSSDSIQTSRINVDRATTVSDDPFFKFYEENGTHTLSVGWDMALTSNVEGDIDTMALVTSENKILRLGFKNQSGTYEFPISVGTGDVTSTTEQRQRSTRVRYLAEPAASYDAVPLGYLTNSYSSRLQLAQIGDSSQRSILQATFASSIDSTDSSGGVGTFFYNTTGNRLEVFRDSSWVSIRSTFDSNETLGIVNNVIDSDYVRARVRTDQDLRTTDTVTFDKVFAHFEGHTEFTARNETGIPVTAGTPVTITGISGNTPLVGLASAIDGPAFGLIHEDANDNAECLVVSAGPLTGLDTSAYTVGTVLYVDTVAGQLTDVAPAGVNNNIQNIGKVLRSHATAGSILVTGAGRANAVSNLSAGQIFYGNDSDRAVPVLATTVFDSDYINARSDHYTTANHDSDTLAQVDSAYVQARVTFPTDLVGIDSATSISLTQSTVDSAYVQTRVDASQLDFSGVPTSDPLSAGLVWRDSDNGNVLKVSVG